MTERDVDPGVSAREVFIFRAWAMTVQKSALSLCVVSGQGKYLLDLREPLFFFCGPTVKPSEFPMTSTKIEQRELPLYSQPQHSVTVQGASLGEML